MRERAVLEQDAVLPDHGDVTHPARIQAAVGAGQQKVQQIKRGGTAQADLAEGAHVDDPQPFPHPFRFRGRVAVGMGPLPLAGVEKPRAGPHVAIVHGSAAHRREEGRPPRQYAERDRGKGRADVGGHGLVHRPARVQRRQPGHRLVAGLALAGPHAHGGIAFKRFYLVKAFGDGHLRLPAGDVHALADKVVRPARFDIGRQRGQHLRRASGGLGRRGALGGGVPGLPPLLVQPREGGVAVHFAGGVHAGRQGAGLHDQPFSAPTGRRPAHAKQVQLRLVPHAQHRQVAGEPAGSAPAGRIPQGDAPEDAAAAGGMKGLALVNRYVLFA